jgi:2-dehydro-3-deoxy-D-arabinonate dehydratase
LHEFETYSIFPRAAIGILLALRPARAGKLVAGGAIHVCCAPEMTMIEIVSTISGLRVRLPNGWWHAPELSLDTVFEAARPMEVVEEAAALRAEAPRVDELMAPVGSQEVWAAGVTYLRSRDARMEESERSGADRLYDMVYEAARPEIFLKATGRRVVGPGEPVRIRSDSRWNVPEPELTLAVNSLGHIIGYTIGNDMSSRDIEGENPLYLPQAKIYRGSCALGPSLVLTDAPLPMDTGIRVAITRSGEIVFEASTALNQMKRSLTELADWLFRENDFPSGAYLMTGTGIVPTAAFTLQSGDVVRIEIDGLGSLENPVA